MTEFYMPAVDSIPAQKSAIPAGDLLWQRMSKEYPSVKMLEVHIPENLQVRRKQPRDRPLGVLR